MRLHSLLAIVALAGLMAVALSARQDVTATLTPQEGIRLMRAVNTTEVQIKSGTGAYGALADVIAHRTFSPGSAGAPALQGTDVALVQSYRLVLVRSANGEHYQAAMTPASGGGTAWFTDERGMIFLGQSLR